MRKLGGVRLKALLSGAAVALSVAGIGTASDARAQVSVELRSFDIAAQPLGQAAVAFSNQAGVQLVLSSGAADGVRANAVQGRYSTVDALARMLAGTGLTWRYVSVGVVAIERAGQEVGDLEAGAIPSGVEVIGTATNVGAQNLDAGGFGRLDGFGPGAGVNGSSDPAATEGTGSYTTNGSTILGGIPRPLQQTTQSVTVMTNQRMEEQNLTDLNQIMQFTPGITVQTNTGTDQSYLSRGFEITNFSIDGGAPISFSPGREGSIDLAEYDRIEIIRGSSGFFGSIGEPGGSLSLIRKRPLNHEQFLLELQGGSFQNYRVMADVSGPIAFDGHLRGRLVASAQDRDFHFDITHETRLKAFGSFEVDLWENALLRVGGSYQNQLVRGSNNSGLPRFRNGDPLPLPRNACLCWPFDRQELNTSELFANFEYRFAENWNLKVDATRTRTEGDYLAIFLRTGTGPGGIAPTATTALVSGGVGTGDTDFRQFGLNATLAGKFDLFGLEQQVVFGALRAEGNFENNQINFSGQRRTTLGFGPGGYMFDPGPLGGPPPAPIPVTLSTLDPIGPDGVATMLPLNFATNLSSVATFRSESEILGAYMLLNLEPIAGLHLEGGVRYTDLTIAGENIILSPLIFSPTFGFLLNFSGRSTVTENAVVPSASIAYDVNSWLTAYISYNDIFSPQNTNFSLNENGGFDPLPPARGETYEGGLRFKLRDGRLNGHIAYYDTSVNGRAVRDSSIVSPNPAISCCFTVAGRSLSQGVDVEVNGEIFSGFQLAASYNYNTNKTSGFPISPGFPNVVSSLFPEHQARLWASYDFRSGPLAGLTMAAGARAESDRSIIASACIAEPCSLPGNRTSAFAFTQPGYVVADALVNYRVGDNMELSLNLYNLFDETYFSQPSGIDGGNFYAPPRSFVFTLRIITGDRY